MFQQAFITEGYLESNLLNTDYLRQIKDATCSEDPNNALPLIKHIPILLKENKRKVIKYIPSFVFDKFIHKTATQKDINSYYNYPKNSLSYERLEYLGDAALHQALSKYIYLRYQEKDEGFLSKVRKGLENGKMQCIFFKKLKLCKYMIIPRYMETRNARLEHKEQMENMFEAFMGALFQELSSDDFYKFVVNFIEKEADFTKIIGVSTDYRGDLNSICNAENPKWIVKCIEEVNKNINNDGFNGKIIVSDYNGRKLYEGFGIGKSKDASYVKAAKSILIQMGKLGNSFNENKDDVYCTASDTDSDNDSNTDSDSDSNSNTDTDNDNDE
jgi:ribonuclease-3